MIDNYHLMDLFSKDFGPSHKSSASMNEEMEFFRSFADSLLSNQPTSRHISSRSSSNDNLVNLNPEDMYFMQNCTSMSNFFDFGLSLPPQQQQHMLSSDEGIHNRFEPATAMSSTEAQASAKNTRNTLIRKPKRESNRSPTRISQENKSDQDQGMDDHLRTSKGSNSRGKKESELEKMIRTECSKKMKYNDNQGDMQYNTSKDRRR